MLTYVCAQRAAEIPVGNSSCRKRLRLKFCILFGLVVLALALVAGPRAGMARGTQSLHPYGVIEIGSRGVRGFVFDIDATSRVECNKDEEAYLACLNLRSVSPINVSPIRPEAKEDTADAVLAHSKELRERYLVPDERIYIVGSSGVAKAEHWDQLAALIESKVKPVNPVGSITVDKESRYAFAGVLSLIPNSVRELRRRQVVVVDIGGGNTKGSFLDLGGGKPRFVSFSFPWGTNTVTDHINAIRGSESFAAAAGAWKTSVLMPAMRSEFDRKPGALNHSRVYLIGGFPWALSTLTQPDYKGSFPRIYAEHLERLHRTAAAPDAEANLCSGNRHLKPGNDVEKVCSVFSTSHILAGTQILDALFKEMKLGNDKKKVFFIRDSQFAWPLGYLHEKLSGEDDM